MYTGKTERPCCLCGDSETATRLDLPPRAIQRLDNAGPIAWRDVVGEIAIHFCADDWATVRDLVLETGMSPLPRCNAARASFDVREDFEALLDDVREEPDQAPVERRMLAEADERIERAEREGRDAVNTRALVEAYVRRWALAATDATDPASDDYD